MAETEMQTQGQELAGLLEELHRQRLSATQLSESTAVLLKATQQQVCNNLKVINQQMVDIQRLSTKIMEMISSSM